jgi:biofilm PGA synthesis N-glycosyltransferase PgaC
MKLRTKYIITISVSAIWFLIVLYFGLPWIADITSQLGAFFAWFTVIGIAFIPGIAMAFINASLLLDKRPKYERLSGKNVPDISILIAAYNEEESIQNSLYSILQQEYSGNIQVLVMNDASTDKTFNKVKEVIELQNWYKKINDNRYKSNISIQHISCPDNGGKAAVLTKGLNSVINEYVITLDADSQLYEDALINIVTTIVNKDDDFAAVAGTILCANAKKSMITKLQEWDYLHGIASVKRVQSMYQGTLVAQGAFSIYKKSILEEVGCWPDKIGEDIVMTWAFHAAGYKVGYAENAICYTNVPVTYNGFYKQRRRWSRGLIEAFKNHSKLLFKKRLDTPFIWYNFVFPYIDVVFLFIFVPGVIAALFFNWYLLASIITIYLLPLALINNSIIYFIQKKTLKELNIKMPNKNWFGFILYMLFFQLIMTPATLSGYVSEILKRKRVW